MHSRPTCGDVTIGTSERQITFTKPFEFFRKAIDKDPAYARAYAGLAGCYNQLGTVLIGGLPPTEVRPLAIAAAKKALEIDPELAEAHAALAYARLYDWEWAAAEDGFQDAIRLNPSYASAHLWYSHYLSMRKRPDEALREVRLAHMLDPLSPHHSNADRMDLTARRAVR